MIITIVFVLLYFLWKLSFLKKPERKKIPQMVMIYKGKPTCFREVKWLDCEEFVTENLFCWVEEQIMIFCLKICFFFYYGKALLIVMHHIILANALDKLEVILEAGLLVYKDVSMIILIIHTYKMHCLM